MEIPQERVRYYVCGTFDVLEVQVHLVAGSGIAQPSWYCVVEFLLTG